MAGKTENFASGTFEDRIQKHFRQQFVPEFLNLRMHCNRNARVRKLRGFHRITPMCMNQFLCESLESKVKDDSKKIWIAVKNTQIDFMSLSHDILSKGVNFDIDGINQINVKINLPSGIKTQDLKFINKLKKSKNKHLKIDLELNGLLEKIEEMEELFLENLLEMDINLLKLINIDYQNKGENDRLIKGFLRLKSVKQLEIQHFKDEEQKFYDQFKLYKLHDLDLQTPDLEDLSTYSEFLEAYFAGKLLPMTTRLKYFVTVE